MLEPAPRQAAVRQRRSRARRKLGRLLLQIEILECETIGALVQAGRISEADAASRARLLAVEKLIADFVERWQARQTFTVTRSLAAVECAGLKDDAEDFLSVENRSDHDHPRNRSGRFGPRRRSRATRLERVLRRDDDLDEQRTWSDDERAEILQRARDNIARRDDQEIYAATAIRRLGARTRKQKSSAPPAIPSAAMRPLE